MAITQVSIDEFLTLSQEHPVLDVRSPGEFTHAHIPGAHSLPLFTDEERKVVGTAYKQESKQIAIKLGLDFFGKKMVNMLAEVEKIIASLSVSEKRKEENKPATLLVHCWRGGMRSAGVAWLLDLYGYKVYTLTGGYKMYRRWALQQFEKDYPIQIVGGYTGSGKTEALQKLVSEHACIIDLEKLASHKGSAFGKLGQAQQPSQEMFENELAKALFRASGQCIKIIAAGGSPVIWMEDESQRIGDVHIPTSFYRTMRTKKLYFLSIPFEERLNFIVSHYGKFEKEKLLNAIIRIKKRLGGLETKTAVNCLLEDDIKGCFSVLLYYYDKFYLKGLQSRDNLEKLFHKIELDMVSAEQSSRKLMDYCELPA